MPAIEVSHVTKEYRLGTLQGLRQAALNAGRRLLGRPVEERPLFKALDDVSFSVEPGEVVGIIGHNGAGKSTLLKMLARISTPTRGSVKVNGRIAPLIEVGAGFVPDFTGRENVYLNGAILGMRKAEIDRKFDEIVDFAEMAEFIDTPVKRYSSGMQVKLAFAVATSIEAEILIVDEVLAVGDLAFQRKCFDRMQSLINGHGSTVILVSHNIRQVERLCNRTMLLSHGKVIADGPPADVCDSFYRASDKQILANRGNARVGRTQSSGDLELVAVEVFDQDGFPTDAVHHLQDVEFRIEYEVKRIVPSPIFGLGVHTTDFFFLATSQSIGAISKPLLEPGRYQVTFRVKRFPFLPGVYSLRLGVALGETFQPVFYSESVRSICVTSKRGAETNVTRGDGFVELEGTWGLHCLNSKPTCVGSQHVEVHVP